MKIALLGYGKMGKVIEKVAEQRGHQIVLRKDNTTSFDGLELADVAIDFSVPTSAVENISACFDRLVPVVCGTTGWLDDYDKVVVLCQEKQAAFLYGSNFSLGVNLFFELNRKLAQLMLPHEQYKVSMEEIHHTQKLDAPSGTAISLANDIIANSNYSSWTLSDAHENQIAISAKRIENVPGTHSVFYDSAVDQIEIKHTAHSREGFALGSVLAAEWIIGKKGVFSMKDVLQFEK